MKAVLFLLGNSDQLVGNREGVVAERLIDLNVFRAELSEGGALRHFDSSRKTTGNQHAFDVFEFRVFSSVIDAIVRIREGYDSCGSGVDIKVRRISFRVSDAESA